MRMIPDYGVKFIFDATFARGRSPQPRFRLYVKWAATAKTPAERGGYNVPQRRKDR